MEVLIFGIKRLGSYRASTQTFLTAEFRLILVQRHER